MLFLGLMVIGGLLVTGAPIYVAFSLGSAVLLLFYANMPFTEIAHFFFSAIEKFTLVAIPLFLLAGNLMTFGGPSKALINLARSVLGHRRGGIAVAAIIGCTFFAAVSGSGIATAIAVGSMIIPKMVELGYSKNLSTAMCAVAGNLGYMIPPSISMIILADITGCSAGTLFIAGIIPGLVISALLIVTAIIVCNRQKITVEERVPWKDRLIFIWKATPALLMPIFVLGGIYGGIFTPTEAAGIAVLYSLLISVFVYREINMENLLKALTQTARSTGVLFLMIGAVVVMGKVLTFMQIPQAITMITLNFQLGALAFTMMVAGLFLILGMFLEAVIIHYVCLPLFLPAIGMLSVPLIPFNIMLVANLMVGNITPPVGVTLYAACSATDTSPLDVAKESIPFLIAVIVGMLLIILFPQLSTFLPSIMVKS